MTRNISIPLSNSSQRDYSPLPSQKVETGRMDQETRRNNQQYIGNISFFKIHILKINGQKTFDATSTPTPPKKKKKVEAVI